MNLRVEVKCKADLYHHIKLSRYSTVIMKEPLTLDEIEDLEINLTDIIKKLQDYRLSQICEGE